MTVYNLTFESFYAGEFGDIEGPITSQVGIFSTPELAEKAKSKTTFVERPFIGQYDTANMKFILTPIKLDTLVVSKYRLK